MTDFRKYLPPFLCQYYPILIQFIRFGIVGSTGLVLDISTVYLLRSMTGLYGATLIAYFIAASSNWLLNRLWTFYTPQTQRPCLSQWIRYLLTNILGLIGNRGVVFILLLSSQYCRNHPYIPIIIGAITGMTANFQLSRKLVFTTNPPKS